MKKLKLGIDIDECLRAKWLQFDRYYSQEFGGESGTEGITEPFNTYDLLNHYKFEDTKETTNYLKDDLPDNVSPKEYVVNENGVAPVDAFAFTKEEVSYTKEELLNRFLYEDFAFEIHGSAPKIYNNADVDIITFMKKYHDKFDFVFVSQEKIETIAPTLFFLSKMKIAVREIYLGKTDEALWSRVDWMITTDPNLIKAKPQPPVLQEGEGTVGYNNKVIKINRQYNLEVEADFDTDNIQYLVIDEAPDCRAFEEFVKNNIK